MKNLTLLVARIEQNHESLPTKENGYRYYIRYGEGKRYPFYCRNRTGARRTARLHAVRCQIGKIAVSPISVPQAAQI